MLNHKAIYAIAAAALGAAAVLAIPAFGPELQAKAGNPAEIIKTDLGLVAFFQSADFGGQIVPPKADRIDFRPLGTACSENAWPHFEANCLRDRNQAKGEVRPVRVIATDRASAK